MVLQMAATQEDIVFLNLVSSFYSKNLQTDLFNTSSASVAAPCP